MLKKRPLTASRRRPDVSRPQCSKDRTSVQRGLPWRSPRPRSVPATHDWGQATPENWPSRHPLALHHVPARLSGPVRSPASQTHVSC